MRIIIEVLKDNQKDQSAIKTDKQKKKTQITNIRNGKMGIAPDLDGRGTHLGPARGHHCGASCRR